MLGTQHMRGTWQDQTNVLGRHGAIFGAPRNMDVERVGHGPEEQVEPRAMSQASRKGAKALGKPLFDLLALGNSRSPFRREGPCIQVVPLPK